jgi:hypothetical protein
MSIPRVTAGLVQWPTRAVDIVALCPSVVSKNEHVPQPSGQK